MIVQTTCDKSMTNMGFLYGRDTYPPRFIAALFTIAKMWNQPKCPLMDEWIKKCGIFTQWNIIQSKKKELLSFVATWMELRSIILSDISQASHKDLNTLFSYHHYMKLWGSHLLETQVDLTNANQKSHLCWEHPHKLKALLCKVLKIKDIGRLCLLIMWKEGKNIDLIEVE
jgi:hypothetical protein